MEKHSEDSKVGRSNYNKNYNYSKNSIELLRMCFTKFTLAKAK